MATPVELPKLGNTVEECIVANWRKRKGDSVSAGEVIAVVETDKATFDLSAPVDGTILETFFEEGALVPVFTNLCVIGDPGENIDPFRPGTPGAATPPAAEATAPEPKPRTAREDRAVQSDPEPIPENDGSPAAVAPGETRKGKSRDGAQRLAPLSPRASRLAREHGIDLSTVTGSGPGGRVLEQDLRKLRKAHVAPLRQAAPSIAKTGESAGTRVSMIREKIAQRMRESLATTAQYTLNASVDAGGLLRLRARIKAAKGLPDINLNDLVAFCTIKALLEAPELNSEFIDGRIVKHPEVHLAFACDTPRGLMVPVIRNAHKLTISELTLRRQELADRAVQGKISPDDLSGGTITISNLGSLGIESFTPVINPPQVAVLGVGAIQPKAVRRQSNIVFIDAIGLSLTCDHQVIDGAPGARFLKVLCEQIENVEALCAI